MKTYLFPALKFSLILMIILGGIYPLTISIIGRFSPGKGDGLSLSYHGKRVGYALIGQKFTKDQYFWSRPSAIDFKADASGGSNKGPSNPAYLKEVESRILYFLEHNPDIHRSEIPSELVTSSGSGLDPDLSPRAAYIQVQRISKLRKLSIPLLNTLIEKTKEKPLLGFLGPEKVNVLKLNIALDEINSNH